MEVQNGTISPLSRVFCLIEDVFTSTSAYFDTTLQLPCQKCQAGAEFCPQGSQKPETRALISVEAAPDHVINAWVSYACHVIRTRKMFDRTAVFLGGGTTATTATTG